MISLIIPASNEEAYIGPCLEALLAQKTERLVEIVVACNACRDGTVAVAEGYAQSFSDRGWELYVLGIKESGKPNALNQADAVASGGIRVYLDADVAMSPRLLEELAVALDCAKPTYASGKLVLAPAQSQVTRAYGRIWRKLPFMTKGVPGAGLFAVNQAGRARWKKFPDIISDDTYVRLLFKPEERVGVAAPYEWPLSEGFFALVRVRRRQDQGVREVGQLYPNLMQNECKPKPSLSYLASLALTYPMDFAIYAIVGKLGRLKPRSGRKWDRGR